MRLTQWLDGVPSTRDRRGRAGATFAFLALFTLPLFLGACGYPQIRVKNDSPYRLDDVRVYSGTIVREFGSLAAGDASAYTTVGEAVEWEKIEAKLGDGGAVLYEPRPNANPGSLGPGFWTYHLRVEPLNGPSASMRLKLHLTQDSYPPD